MSADGSATVFFSGGTITRTVNDATMGADFDFQNGCLFAPLRIPASEVGKVPAPPLPNAKPDTRTSLTCSAPPLPTEPCSDSEGTDMGLPDVRHGSPHRGEAFGDDPGAAAGRGLRGGYHHHPR